MKFDFDNKIPVKLASFQKQALLDLVCIIIISLSTIVPIGIINIYGLVFCFDYWFKKGIIWVKQVIREFYTIILSLSDI